MASLLFSFAPPTVRVYATKVSAPTKEEKGFLDWILGNLTKEDQFYETNPLLNKVEAKSTKNSVSFPQKKNNGGVFGGLLAKK